MEKTKKVVKKPQVVEQPKVEVKQPQTPKDNWEIKDRLYILSGNKQPIAYKIPSKHTRRHPLLWFDSENSIQRELRYATNQNSPFADEQKGEATLGHIVFRNGTLTVSSRHQALQKLLSLYHPMKDRIYFEDDKVAKAANETDWIELEFQAVAHARELSIDQAEAILRVELGSKVSKMSSKEIKRDILVMAKRQPAMLLDLIQDENIELRNIAIKAVEENIFKLSSDQRSFTWGSSGRKLMTVPFDEHPYSALAAWFKTDEGLEVLKSVEQKLK